MGFAKSAGLAQEPLINAYGNPADAGVVHDDFTLLTDSSMYKPTDANPLFAGNLTDLF